RDVGGGDAVVLGRTTGARPRGPADGDLDVASGHELVEVVTGDVGVQVEVLGDGRGGHTVLVLVDEQVDLASGRIAERRGHGGDDRREVGRGQGRTLHAGIVPIAVVVIPESPSREQPMPVSEDQALDVLRPVEDPELRRSIVDLGMVRAIDVNGPRVAVRVALTVAGCPLRNEIQDRVTTAVRALDGVEDVALDFTVMTDEERAELRNRLHGDPAATAGSQQAHGHAEGRAIPFADPDSRTRVLLIASGKGGVGKSSVTANLAIALARR